MLRTLLIAGALAAFAAAPQATAAPKLLMPGVTYDRQVEFTTHGPVVIHVLTAPRPGGLWSLKPVLSNDTILGVERLTTIERRIAPAATVAGVNGDLFNSADGHPTGILLRSGALEHTPISGRSSIGIDSQGLLHVDRVTLIATWQGSGPRRALLGVNEPARPNGVSLFTPAWGPATPATPGSVEVVLSPFPPLTPNTPAAGPVTQVVQNGNSPIPAGGAVLVARGTAAARLAAEAPVAQNVVLRPVLKPSWTGIVDAIGGGPVLVRRAAPVFRANELFTTDQLLPLAPRTGVGQLSDGRIILVAVDGAQPGYSTGMTNFELAQTLVRLGAVTGSALDSGGSSTMAFDGALLNRPSDVAGERPVAEALAVMYTGVYAPPPLEPVLSPNGDGVAEREVLSYKIVRPSNVAANLVGPDGTPRFSFAGPLEPGVYPLTWEGKKPDGAPDTEGRYRWLVTAVDDRGQTSTIERRFTLNLTLGFARPLGAVLGVPRLNPRPIASFQLTRPAIVTARVETPTGVVLRTLERQNVAGGPIEVEWDGVTDTGALVYSGRYVARLIATNELGTVALTSSFTVRRLPGRS